MKDDKKIIGQISKQIVRSDMADSFLEAALNMVEEQETMANIRTLQRRIATSCISSFLSLEASINRIYYDVFETKQGHKRDIKTNIPKSISNYIKRDWNRLSVKDKFLLLPPLISDFEFEPTSKPFNLFNEFISFRNSLIHSKTWEVEHSVMVEHVDMDENKGGSWGGKLIETRLIETPKQSYPLTKFSNSTVGLTKTDAEKALEICCLMRIEIFKNLVTADPIFYFDPPRNGKHIAVGESVLDYIPRHFNNP